MKIKEYLLLEEKVKIRIYRIDNYECIQIIENAHDENIMGFIELKNGNIISFSKDKKIKIWRF